jgi:glycerol-3-phosphate dehydrogenase
VSRVEGIHGEAFDVVIVGGGIIGCGAARDAALRGLKVALIERADFGSGTTAASTRIVHGGLRYLEQLDIRLVRLDLRERETLLRIAPHLVTPLEFLIPFFGRQRTTALKLRAGLALYDALSFDKSLPSRRWLSGPEARAADRVLDRPDVSGAAAYHDARVDCPERLAVENVMDAERHGARVVNYCEALTIGRGDGRRLTVRVRDHLGQQEAEITARVVLNATGAWVDPVATALTGRRAAAIRTTKGIHLVCAALTTRALVLFSELDRRLLFAIPRAGLTWIGTTDTDFSGDPRDARATRADVDYLIQSVRHVFPSLSRADVLFTTAGVRALVRRGGTESSVSRMHKVIDGEPLGPAGVVTVLGGKITGYRAIAEQAIDVVCRRLGARRLCTTSERPLPGAEAAETPTRGGSRAGAAEQLRRHLVALYGARAEQVLALADTSPELRAPLAAAYPDIGAQVIYGVRSEYCVRLDDFLHRRTLLGATPDRGARAIAPAATLMARELGWSATRQAAEARTALRSPGSDLDSSG